MRTLYIFLVFIFLSTKITTGAEFTDQELIYMPANVQITLFKQGLLSPVDVVKAQIKQYNKTNTRINSVTYTHFDKALTQAKKAEEHYKNQTNRPLEGITIGLKDEHFAKGMIVTQGSLIYKDSKPKDYTDEMTQKLLDAGAIILVQTTVPEFYLSFCTNSRAWGVTKNPWNTKYTVGGSSGGSAASLAAGYVTLATGSDMAGSIRIPAALNGLYGYKPPFGEVYTDLPFSYFSGTGALARTFSDLLLMRNIIAGQTPNSINVKPFIKIPSDTDDIKGMRIAYIGGMGIFSPTKGTSKQIDNALQVLRRAGAIVDKVEINLDIDPITLATSVSNMALSGAMSKLFTGYADKTELMTDYATMFVKDAVNNNGYNRNKLAEIENLVKQLYKKISSKTFNKGYDILLAPTVITSNIPAEMDVINDILTEDGVELPTFCGVLYTIPFNLLNWMPVISVPAGLNENNMPVGMQIIGKPGDSETVFKVANQYSKKAAKLFKDKNFPKVR